MCEIGLKNALEAQEKHHPTLHSAAYSVNIFQVHLNLELFVTNFDLNEINFRSKFLALKYPIVFTKLFYNF